MKIRIGDFERYGTKKTTDGMMFTFVPSVCMTVRIKRL